jgi:hypothetical protein
MNKITTQKKFSGLLLLVSILALIAMISFQVDFTSAQSQGSYLGFSGYVTSISKLQGTIDIMHAQGLNTYRICFKPSWLNSEGSYHGYNTAWIDYVLDNTNFQIIVDGNHLYPPSEETAADARAHWSEVRGRIFQILQRYPNNPRVAVELINEYAADDFNSLMQGLIDDIRNAGYSNIIVANKWNTYWHSLSDPLGKTYQGYHYYFNSWSVSGAMIQMGYAQSNGIKVINTEIGASYNEYGDFTQSNVNELSDFIAQCNSIGAGNLIWMNNDHDNWIYGYQNYNLNLGSQQPTPTPLPTPTPIATPTPTPTPLPTPTPIATPTPTPSATPNPTSTPSPVSTPMPTSNPTPSPDPSSTPSPTPNSTLPTDQTPLSNSTLSNSTLIPVTTPQPTPNSTIIATPAPTTSDSTLEISHTQPQIEDKRREYQRYWRYQLFIRYIRF